jgi:hypothetical protein
MGYSVYKGPKFFFTMSTLWVYKRRRILVDFKNINLLKWQNAPKKLFLKKHAKLGLYNISPNLALFYELFLGAFCLWGKFIFLKST